MWLRHIHYPKDYLSLLTGSSYQTTVSLYKASTSTANAYFKIDPPVDPVGTLSIKKTTEDGKNLSGWQFALYTDAGCTSKHSGPHTTNSTGALTIANLKAGTYYVKEIGNTNASISTQYYCASVNPQKVVITSGGTASLSFTNKLNHGSLKIVKYTNTGKNLDGWKIGIYTDSACTKAISGSPFTTGTDGTVTVNNLMPGTYYAKEVASADPFWECDTSVKGSCSTEAVKDGCLTTGADGKLIWDGLHASLKYRLTEISAPDGYNKLIKPAYEGYIPAATMTIEIQVVNTHIFNLPETGSNTLRNMALLNAAACIIGITASAYSLKKKREEQ